LPDRQETVTVAVRSETSAPPLQWTSAAGSEVRSVSGICSQSNLLQIDDPSTACVKDPRLGTTSCWRRSRMPVIVDGPSVRLFVGSTTLPIAAVADVRRDVQLIANGTGGCGRRFA
jgi:hypothetical protein